MGFWDSVRRRTPLDTTPSGDLFAQIGPTHLPEGLTNDLTPGGPNPLGPSPLAPSESPATVQLGTSPLPGFGGPRQDLMGEAMGQTRGLLDMIGPAPTAPYAENQAPIITDPIMRHLLLHGWQSASPQVSFTPQQQATGSIYASQMSGHNNRLEAARQTLGDILKNQLGQGQLGFQYAQEFGLPGQAPGAHLLNAQGNTAERENQRMAGAFFNNAYQNFPPGTPHEVRMRQLAASGLHAPGFLANVAGGGPREQMGPPRGAPLNPVVGVDQIDRAFQAAAPMNQQTNRRQWPAEADTEGVNNAITNIFSSIPDDATLRQHFPEIQRRLSEEVPGGPQALNRWLQQTMWSNPLTGNPLSGNPQTAETHRQIRRILALAGQRAGAGENLGVLGFSPTVAIGAPIMNQVRNLFGSR